MEGQPTHPHQRCSRLGGLSDQFRQAIVGQWLDWPEVPVGNVFGPLVAPDVVADGTKAEIDDRASKRADVGWTCVDQVAVKQHD